MFNYDEIDKYITLNDLILIMKWFDEVDKKTPGSYMVRTIERSDNEYAFHITDAGLGYTKSFRIENGVVEHLGTKNFWMS